MTRRTRVCTAVLVAVGLAGLAAPPLANASTPTMVAVVATSASSSPEGPFAEDAVARPSAYKWRLPRRVDRRSNVKTTVKFARAHKGRKAKIQIRSKGGWTTVDKGKENKAGRIRFAFTVVDAGKYQVRVKFKRAKHVRGGVTPTKKLRVVVPVVAPPEELYYQGNIWLEYYTIGEAFAYWLPTTGYRDLDTDRYLSGLETSSVGWTAAGPPEQLRLIGHFSVRRPASGLTPESYDLGLVVVNPRSNKVERIFYYSTGLTGDEEYALYGFRRSWEEPTGSDISTTVLVQGAEHGAGPTTYSINWLTGQVVWKARGALKGDNTRIALVEEPIASDCEQYRGIHIANGATAFKVTPVPDDGGCITDGGLYGNDDNSYGIHPQNRYFEISWRDPANNRYERWYDGTDGRPLAWFDEQGLTYDSVGKTFGYQTGWRDLAVRDALTGATLYQMSTDQVDALDASFVDLYNRVLYFSTSDEELGVNVDNDSVFPATPPYRKVTELPGYWTYYTDGRSEYLALDR